MKRKNVHCLIFIGLGLFNSFFAMADPTQEEENIRRAKAESVHTAHEEADVRRAKEASLKVLDSRDQRKQADVDMLKAQKASLKSKEDDDVRKAVQDSLAASQLSGQPDGGREKVINPYITLRQLRVLPQAGTVGGATCGYHALKNGLVAAQALVAGRDMQQTLEDHDLAVRLFAPDGQWRTFTQARRELRALMYSIDKMLKVTLRPDREIQEPLFITRNGVSRLYRNKLTNLARQWAQAIIAGQVIVINQEQVIRALRIIPLQIVDNSWLDYGFATQGHLQHYMNNPDIMRRYLNLDNLVQREFGPNSAKIACDEYNIDAQRLGTFSQFAPQGDFINDGEINDLITHEQRPGGALHNLGVEFTVIQDIEHQDDNDEHNLLEARRNFQLLDRFIHVFILGTMNRACAAAGHWYTVVVFKQHARSDFIVMDSGNNFGLLNSPRVHELIIRLS